MHGTEGRSCAATEALKSAMDPLMDLIEAYRSGMADFNANAPEDPAAANAYAERVYRQQRRRLVMWDGPALTLEGAVSAIRMARDADRNDDDEIVSAMIKASCRYFEAHC